MVIWELAGQERNLQLQSTISLKGREECRGGQGKGEEGRGGEARGQEGKEREERQRNQVRAKLEKQLF